VNHQSVKLAAQLRPDVSTLSDQDDLSSLLRRIVADAGLRRASSAITGSGSQSPIASERS
jgi:hypothetical protein